MLSFLLPMLLTAGAPETPLPLAATAAAESGAPATVGSLALGVEIATLLNNEEITLQQTAKMFDQTIPAAFAANAEMAALEEYYPGIIRYMLDAMRPEVDRQVAARLPELWNRLGAVYSGALTDTEMRELLTFYRSPTGRWLIESLAAGSDVTKMVESIIANPDAGVTASDLKIAIQDSARDDLARTMTKQRTTDILRLATTPAGRKVRALNPKLLEVAAAWSNETTPEEDARLNAIVESVVKKFIDAPENDKSRQSK